MARLKCPTGGSYDGRMVELLHAVAVVVSLGAALSAASHNLLVRRGTETGDALQAVYVVILVNLLVLVPTVAVWYYPDYGLTPASWVSFAAAGLVATMLARLLAYRSIATIGASRTAPIVSSWALVSTVLGVALLGETLVPAHGLGVVLTVVGVGVIAWETGQENPDDLPRRELLVGLAVPFAAALAYGWEPIFANYGFAEGTPAPVGLAIKTVAAALGFTAYLNFRGAVPGRAEFRSPNTRWYAAAGVMSALFLLGYYTALSLAPVSVVTPIMATSTLFVVVLSALVMPRRLERVTWRLVAAAVVVVVGVVVVSVYG